MKGKVGIGYRLFNEIFLGMAVGERQVINEYALIQNKVSEFIYQPIIEHVHGLALRREKFNDLMQVSFWKKFTPLWTKIYEKKIQRIMHEHREDMAEKFQNRIDYVDLSAFGVGFNNDNKEEGLSIEDHERYIEMFTGQGKLTQKLIKFD